MPFEIDSVLMQHILEILVMLLVTSILTALILWIRHRGRLKQERLKYEQLLKSQQELQGQLDGKLKLISGKESDIETLNVELSDSKKLNSEYNSRITYLQSFERMYDEVNGNYEDAKSYIVKLKQENANLEESRLIMTEQLGDVHTEKEELEKQQKTLESSALSYKDLEDKYRVLYANSGTQKEEMAAIKNKLDELAKKESKASKELIEATAKVNDLSDALEDLEDAKVKYDELFPEYESLKEELEASRRIQPDLTGVRKRLEQVEIDNHNLRVQLTKLTTKNNQLQASVSRKSAFSAPVQQTSVSKSPLAQFAMDDPQGDAAKLRKKIRHLEEHNFKLTMALDQASKGYKVDLSNLSTDGSFIPAIDSAKQENDAEVEQLKKEKEAMTSLKAKLEKELETKSAELMKAKASVDKQLKLIAGLESDLTNCKESKVESKPKPKIEEKQSPLKLVVESPVKKEEKPAEELPLFKEEVKKVEEKPAPKPIPVVETPPSNEPKSKKELELDAIRKKVSMINFDQIGRAEESDRDDLKRIKGIGPFIEEKLNALGIYTFWQIANFTADDEEKVSDAISFFPGRIKRDKWVRQAKKFAKNA